MVVSNLSNYYSKDNFFDWLWLELPKIHGEFRIAEYVNDNSWW